MFNVIKEKIRNNIVTLVFLLMCIFGFIASGQTFSFLLSEVVARLFRNFGLVFSLVIPVIAGIGLNFGIVLGAMAAQAAIIFVTHWRIQGVAALGVAAIISIPLAIVFGWLLGQLFNRTKGQEMITGMIAGYFANGIYQLFFLVLVGTIIPMADERIISYNGIGVIDTLRLEDSVAGSLDRIWKLKASVLVAILIAVALVYLAVRIIRTLRSNPANKMAIIKPSIYIVLLIVTALLCHFNKQVSFALSFTKVPMVPLILMALFGLLINAILNTKLGQDFRAIGMNKKVSAAAGINVDQTRIIAIILSTILAAMGQIIFLQNLGNFTTYSSHEKVGLFAVAAILVGGASVERATVKQGIIGIILFHTLFVIAPLAGKSLLGDAAYGEYFREAISYGVITLSLVLHITGRSKQKKTGTGGAEPR